MGSRTLARAIACALVLALSLPSGAAFAADEGLAQIRGVLLDQQGMPAVGHQIGVKSGAGDLMLSPPTGQDGHFVLSNLPPGKYELVAFDPEGAQFPVLSQEVTLEPGQIERLEVRISGPAQPPGRTRSPAPEPAAGSKGAFGWFRGLSTVSKVAIVVAGAAAVGLAVDSDDDDDSPPVSPSSF
jgi:hypothetical protein